MNPLLLRKKAYRSDFEKIFFGNEFRELAGKNLRTIIVLVCILFITFLALGFASGSLNNLQKKMENPFTNWVNLDVSENRISKKSRDIVQRYNSPELVKELQINNSNGFSKYVLNFYKKDYSPFHHPPDTLTSQLWGRTIEASEALLTRILNPSTGNLIWVSDQLYLENGDINWNGCEIVITSAMMEILGYSTPDDLGYIGLQEERRVVNQDSLTFGLWMPLKVVAVVKELPDAEFISAPGLYNALHNKYYSQNKSCRTESVSENLEGDTRFFLISDDPERASRLNELAHSYFSGTPSITPLTSFPSGNKNWTGFRFAFFATDAPDIQELRNFIAFAGKDIPLNEFSFVNCEWNPCKELSPENFHYLAFHFDRLDNIRAFRDDLSEEFDIDIDMSQVESKENFALVSQLTIATSIFLVVFSIISIALFVSNLLQAHLFKVRSNLGTFQAFGLSNYSLIRLYLEIIFFFLLIAIAISFILAAGVDFLNWLILHEESNFDVFNVWIFTAVGGLMLISLVLSGFTISRILGDTPGNLIYER